MTNNSKWVQEMNLQVVAKNLSELVTKLIGVETNISVEIGGRKMETLQLKSNELSQNMVPKMFTALHIENFGGGVAIQPNVEGDAAFEYWLPIHYSYQHIEGGSNGTEIATVWLNKDGSVKEIRTSF